MSGGKERQEHGQMGRVNIQIILCGSSVRETRKEVARQIGQERICGRRRKFVV